MRPLWTIFIEGMITYNFFCMQKKLQTGWRQSSWSVPLELDRFKTAVQSHSFLAQVPEKVPETERQNESVWPDDGIKKYPNWVESETKTQMTEQLLSILEDSGSNPIIGNFN